MPDLRFSQRIGAAPVRVDFQRDEMSDELRNSLWNVIYIDILGGDGMDSYNTRLESTGLQRFARVMWTDFYKSPVDTVPMSSMIKSAIKNRFFKASWAEAYDFVEWIASLRICSAATLERFNKVLSAENSAYRLIDRSLIPIIDNVEIAALEAATTDDSFQEATTHLRRAMELHSDRESPDYRNSIKESISAVEAMARIVTQDPKATLGSALKAIETKYALHPALSGAWQKLYGFTNDGGGIRHAITEGHDPDEALSRLMLVSCASFVNYLKTKIPS